MVLSTQSDHGAGRLEVKLNAQEDSCNDVRRLGGVYFETAAGLAATIDPRLLALPARYPHEAGDTITPCAPPCSPAEPTAESSAACRFLAGGR